MHAIEAFVRTEECGAASAFTMAGVSQRGVIAMLGDRDARMAIRYVVGLRSFELAGVATA